MFRCRSYKVLLVAGCLCAACIIAAASWYEADRQDKRFLKTQLAIATYEVDDVYKDLEGRLIARAYRDNTYDHIVRKWDAGWIAQEMNVYLSNIGVQLVAIFGPDGKVRYLGRGMHDYAINTAQLETGKGIPALLAGVKRLPPKRMQTQKGIVVVNGEVFFAAAEKISPVSNSPAKGDPTYTLLFLDPAKNEHFYALAIGFHAEDVHVAIGMHQPDKTVSLPLKDAAGNTLAHLGWRTPTPGASILWVLLPVLAAMFLLQVVALIVYIGRWRQAQQILMESQAKIDATQAENRLKSIFIGNISHELRTPLNAILGFAEMLQLQVFGPLGSPRYKEYADHIMASGRSMLNMVNDLIEIVRIRSKDTAQEREAVDITACLHMVVENALPAATKKNVHLVLDRSGAHLWCMGSEISLKTALSKLYATAIELTDNGNEISAAIESADGEAVIRIHDPGPTPATEVIERINNDQYLFSTDHMVSREGNIGLNFEIAKGLVQLMGGRLRLVEAEQGGVIADMRLPEIPEPSDAQHPVESIMA